MNYLFKLLLLLHIFSISCQTKKSIKHTNRDFYKEIITYIDSSVTDTILSKLIIADSLFYSHKLIAAYNLYNSLYEKGSQSIFNYILFRKNEIAQKINQFDCIEKSIPERTDIIFNTKKRFIDSVLKVLDEINLNNLVNNKELDDIFIKVSINSFIPDYWKAKIFQIFGEYYTYHTANPYKAYEFLKLSSKYFNILKFKTHEVIYLNKELIQHTIGSREYLIGRHYGSEMISISEKYFPNDTVLKSISYYMSGYADGLTMPYAEYISKYRIAIETIGNTKLEKLKQQIYFSFIYRFKRSNNKKLLDSLDNDLLKSISKSDTFINLHKYLGEKAKDGGYYSMAIKHFEKAKSYVLKQKRTNPANFWTITSNLIECYKSQGLFDKSDKEGYDNINYLYEYKCHNYRDILKGKADIGFYNFIIIGDLIDNLYRRYLTSNKIKYLYTSIKLIEKANELIIKENYSIEENRRIDLLEYSKSIYFSGQKIHYELYSKTKSIKYLEKFYIYQEKMKGIILNSESAHLRRKFNIPDSIYNYELRLKSGIRNYRMGLQSNNEVNIIYSKLDTLNKFYKKYYPAFYTTRLNGEIKSFRELGLNDSIIFISYSIIDDHLYTLYISDSMIINKRPFINISKNVQIILKLQSISQFSSNEYVNISKELYYNLVDSSIVKNKKILIYCPSSQLSLLNLKSCFTNKKGKMVSAFFDVYHTFSASSMNIKGINVNEKGKTVAFSFSNEKTIKSPILKLPELPGAYLEVKRIQLENANNKIYSGTNANKSNLIKVYTDTSVIHLYLALHGVSMSAQRENVFLILRKGLSNLDTLRGYELLNFRSNISTISLASCETGIGVNIESEGLYNLVRYFKSNGACRINASFVKLKDLEKTSKEIICFI